MNNLVICTKQKESRERLINVLYAHPTWTMAVIITIHESYCVFDV